MMKKYVLLLTFLLSFLTICAETVSQKQAQRLANLFFNEAAGRHTPPPKLVYNGRKLTTGRLFTPFYVYNSSSNSFVIISAENKAFPILGFSLKESFNPEVLGDADIALLKSYAREIELVRYDSQPVYEASDTWINFDKYVNDILKAQYIATDPLLSIDDADMRVFYAEKSDDAVYSDLYTPGQWQDLILEELSISQSVPLLIYDGKEDFPAVIYGHQGDYFRIELSGRNQWLMRLNATETIAANMVTCLPDSYIPTAIIEEETPFADLDDYLDELGEMELARTNLSSIDKIMPDSAASLIPLGSGHYQITLPENANLSSVYNLSGALITHSKYHDTSVVNIDISAEPTGFYFINIFGESGSPYGFKLIR